MDETPPQDNGDLLHAVIRASGLKQEEALALFNQGQLRPLSLRSLKYYVASRKAEKRLPCSDQILSRFAEVCEVDLAGLRQPHT